ncbi:hypothetical protein EJ03DRAFT_354950 [Teratosphaeria nubilosa]|uniref:F-box domain-containing protein n=1 Tax=Teratosphaeria nubilosa TaxID=161662 RepID=A0A6G1KY76_9PEZI|nr:hypothetical protein EJ03DRAFT_354950 [Teratosphaeria nubilosa]
MDASPLQKLPAELRNDIYELVLTQNRPINLSVGKKKDECLAKLDYNNRRISPNFLAITTTCRTIRADTRQMFYFVNDFVVGRQGMDKIPADAAMPNKIRAFTNNHMARINRFLCTIGTENATSIGSITFRLDIGIHPYDSAPFGDLKAVGRALISELRALAGDIPLRRAAVTLVFTQVDRWSDSNMLTEQTVNFASEAADWAKMLSKKMKNRAMLSWHFQEIMEFVEEMLEQAEARAIGD